MYPLNTLGVKNMPCVMSLFRSGKDNFVYVHWLYVVSLGLILVKKVIVGSNGSGKSTILKLICRLYDPTEGQILFDGRDIRTLKLVDIRKALSVLFQDYTCFPLSVGAFTE
jgi:ABC-type transport system involved in Fe-S cluster assembly fused permease/ATPase subunit